MDHLILPVIAIPSRTVTGGIETLVWEVVQIAKQVNFYIQSDHILFYC